MLIQSLGLIVNWFCLKTTMTFISWKQMSCKARHVDQLLSVTCVWACMQKQSLAFSWLLKWLWSRSVYESWIDIFSSMSGDFFCKLFQKNYPLLSEMHVPVAAHLPSMREKLLLTWEIVIHHSSATEQAYVHKQAPSAVKSGTFNKLKNSSCSQQPRQIHLTQGVRGIYTSLMDRADGWSYRCYTCL